MKNHIIKCDVESNWTIGNHSADEKEEEIQIGFPTDVKHVAHIGSDDPSANAPSWVLFSFFRLFYLIL